MGEDGWLCRQVGLAPALLHLPLFFRSRFLGKDIEPLMAPGFHLLAEQPQKKTQHRFLRSSK